jgi:O-antigen ligase
VTARAELLPNRLLAGALLTSALLVGLLAGYSPPLAIALTLGVVFVVLTLGNLTAGVCIFAVLSFLDTALPVQGTLSAPKLLGLMLMLSWLALVTAGEREHRERIFSHPGFLFVLVLFVGWTLLSATWADHPGAALEAFTRYLPNAMLFLIVFAAVRTRDQLLWVVGAFVVGAFLSGVYGIIVPPPPQDLGRLAGAGGDPNETAAALVAAAAIAIALAVSWRDKPFMRVVAIVVAPLCAFASLLTLSRGGLVAFAAALIAAVLMAGRRRPQMMLLAGVSAALVVGYFAFFAPASAVERVTEVHGGTGRTDIWKVGLRMVQGAPLQGIGAGNFPIVSIHYLLEPGALLRDDFIVQTPKVAHNTYLEVLAELGVVGLTLFLIVVFFAIGCAVRAARYAAEVKDREIDILARALVVALASLLAANFFISREYSKQLWLLFALGPVMLEILRRDHGVARGRPGRAP